MAGLRDRPCAHLLVSQHVPSFVSYTFTIIFLCAFISLPTLAASVRIDLSPRAARSLGRVLASVRIYLSPSLCLHLSPSAATSPGRMLASVRIYLSFHPRLHACQCSHLLVSQNLSSFVSLCCQCCQIAGPHASERFYLSPESFHVPPKAARSPGRMLASARIYLSPSMCLHLSFNATRSPGRASAFTCLPNVSRLPDCRAACSPLRRLISQYVPAFVSQCYHIAGPHARQCAHLSVFQHDPSFLSHCCTHASVRIHLSFRMCPGCRVACAIT